MQTTIITPPPTTFTIYDGGTELRVLQPPATTTIRSVLATASLDRHLFVVSQAHDLFAGYVDIGANSVAVRLVRRGDVRDVHCSSFDGRVYVVATDGALHHLAVNRNNCMEAMRASTNDDAINDDDDDRQITKGWWTELSITGDKRATCVRCPHGVLLRSAADRSVRMMAVTGNADGVVFTSVHGELFGMGRFGALLPPQSPDATTAVVPVMFECFRGLCVRQAVAGERYVLVLTAPAADERGECGSAVINGGDDVLPSSSETSLSTDGDHSDDGNESMECGQCMASSGRGGEEADDEVSSVFEMCNISSSSAHSLNGFDESAVRANTIRHLMLGDSKPAAYQLTSMGRDGVRRLTRRLSISSEAVNSGAGGHDERSDMTDETSEADVDGIDSMSLHSTATGTDAEDDGQHLDISITTTTTTASKPTASCSATIAELCRLGEAQLGTSVWSFGTVSAEDAAGLTTPNSASARLISQVLGLSGQGVCDIRSGAAHWVARTLDGRLYVWGDDRATDTLLNIRPRLLLQLPLQLDNVLDVACGRNSIAVLTNRLQLQVHTLGASGGGSAAPTLVVWPYRKSRDAKQPEPGGLLLGTAEFGVQNAARPARKHIEMHFTAEQRHLRDILTTYNDILKPLLKRMHFVTTNGSANNAAASKAPSLAHVQLVEALSDSHQQMVRLAANSVRSMHAYFRGQLHAAELPALLHSAAHISAHRRYTRRLADLLAMPAALNGQADGFLHGFLHGTAEAAVKSDVFDDGGSHARGDTLEMLWRPLRRADQVVELLSTLMLSSDPPTVEPPNTNSTSVLAERRQAWERCKTDADRAIDRALATGTLWQLAGRTLTGWLYRRDRRLVLDSKEAPLKWPAGGRFASHWWMLFDDVLCRSSGMTVSELHVYRLETVWADRGDEPLMPPSASAQQLKSPAGTAVTVLRVRTPEETFELLEPTKGVAVEPRWLLALQTAIRRRLRRGQPAAMVPAANHHRRQAAHTFGERHARYARAKYFGGWLAGRMHGLGQLELVDGTVYNGEFADGELCGYGRMFTPGVGVYVGDFVAGRYHGRGVLEQRSGRASKYAGHFRGGLYDGHGVLQTDQYTYVGEFRAGRKSGYGVLDDAVAGDKYMGTFAEDKRSGAGVLITMEGGYFEGGFVEDRLCGEGVAMLADGVWYEGEMTAWGPSGKGTLCVPAATTSGAAAGSIIDGGDGGGGEVSGVVLNGSLGGTWDEVRIVSGGSLSVGQRFRRVPRSLGLLAPEHRHKWRALFADWETDVFGASTHTSDLSLGQLWHQFAVYQTAAERRTMLDGGSSSVDDDADDTDGSNLTTFRRASLTNIADLFAVTSAAARAAAARADRTQPDEDEDEGDDDDDDDDSANNMPLYKSNLCVATAADASSAIKLGPKASSHNDITERLLNAQFTKESVSNGAAGTSRLPSNGTNHLQPSSVIPSFATAAGLPLSAADLAALRLYIGAAFRSRSHPLGVLNRRIAHCFYSAYGCWKVRPTPVLCAQAMQEWSTVCVLRIYVWLCRLFPALAAAVAVDGDSGSGSSEPVTARSLLLPVLLTERVYSTMFVLYASRCATVDELYRQRLLAAATKSDDELAALVRLDRALWPLVRSAGFAEATALLRLVKEKFGPHEMLATIESTFRRIDRARRDEAIAWAASTGAAAADSVSRNLLSADHIMPLSIYLILRAGIPHLGAELLLMEELLGDDFDGVMSGFGGYCFVTVKATYQHISSSQFEKD